MPTIQRRNETISDVPVRLMYEDGIPEGDVVFLSRVPTAGEEIEVPAMRSVFRVIAVRHNGELDNGEHQHLAGTLRVAKVDPDW